MVGRSQVVSHDVAESIDSMLPPLLKVFTSGDELVRFDPRNPKQEQMAKQATEYINWIWMVRNPGFTILHDWFKDALWKKLGVIHIDWEVVDTKETETYKGLNEQELGMLKDDDDVEIIAEEPRQHLIGAPGIAIPPGANVPQPLQQTVYDVILKHTQGSALPVLAL
jgi:hypothetical protein